MIVAFISSLDQFRLSLMAPAGEVPMARESAGGWPQTHHYQCRRDTPIAVYPSFAHPVFALACSLFSCFFSLSSSAIICDTIASQPFFLSIQSNVHFR
jgi:hypothetical protein